MLDNSDIKAKYQSDLAIVRALVNEFDPCGFITLLKCPEDEYDYMNVTVLRMCYDSKPKQEVKDYMVHQIEHYYGTPDLSVLNEPHKSDFFRDLDKVLDGLEKHFGNKVPQ